MYLNYSKLHTPCICFVFAHAQLVVMKINIANIKKRCILTTAFAIWSLEYCKNWSCYKQV